MFQQLVLIGLCGTVSLLTLAAAASAAGDLPEPIAPLDPHVQYMGRWDTRDSAGPRCEWPATAFTLHFHGVAASVTLKDSGSNYFQITVDGKPADVLHPGSGVSTHALAAGLPEADHTVELFRRTEASQGPTQVLGFHLSDGAKLLEPEKRTRRIEVIGDSISCGYGNEGKSQQEHFQPSTENAWLTYGAITARHFAADYACIAWSGRKMWPDNTIPGIYGLNLPTDKTSRCDFDKMPRPDVIVINLSTNDFASKVPDEAGWTGAYTDFVKRLRRLYPEAFIYLTTGPMMGGDSRQLTTLKSYLEKIVTDLQAAGEKNVGRIDFAPQDMKNGLGADWHPNLKTHEIMAEALEQAVAKDLRWKPVETGK